MSSNFYSLKKICDLFGSKNIKQNILDLEDKELIPESQKKRTGAIYQKGWDLSELSEIGKHVGFLNKLPKPMCVSVFTTKGGVLKSTLALNFSRIAALHNYRVCVVGLDIQGDITSALGYDTENFEDDNLGEVINKLNMIKGLPDYFNGNNRLNDLIVETDLENLFIIPETPELVALNDYLSNIHRREYWLSEKVIEPLKDFFDIIVIDCSPNWNKLTTNALVACDLLLSPLECKINNFRNFKIFQHFLNEFKSDMHLDFESIFIPTRYSNNKKLSLEIKNWYQSNVSGCSEHGIRESVQGEEATAMHKSIVEHAPTHALSDDIRSLMSEIQTRINDFQHDKIIPRLKKSMPFANNPDIM